MGDIIDLLKGIVDACSSLVSYGIQSIKDIGNFIVNLTQIPSQLSQSFGLFPTVLVPFIVYSIGLVILLRCIGRE